VKLEAIGVVGLFEKMTASGPSAQLLKVISVKAISSFFNTDGYRRC